MIDDDERPFRILNAAGDTVFKLAPVDQRIAEQIVAALNAGVTLSPDDNDELAEAG